jgi:hypothetical protein
MQEPRKTLVILTGRKSSGKTTLEHVLSAFLCQNSVPMGTIAFAEPLKIAAACLFTGRLSDFHDVSAKDTPLVEWGNCTPRDILLALGDTLRFDLPKRSPWLWNALVRRAVHGVNAFFKTQSSTSAVMIVSDARLPEEISALMAIPDVRIVVFRVTRPSLPAIDPATAHATETALDNLPGCIELVNDGTPTDLMRKALTHLEMMHA